MKKQIEEQQESLRRVNQNILKQELKLKREGIDPQNDGYYSALINSKQRIEVDLSAFEKLDQSVAMDTAILPVLERRANTHLVEKFKQMCSVALDVPVTELTPRMFFNLNQNDIVALMKGKKPGFGRSSYDLVIGIIGRDMGLYLPGVKY